MYKRVNNQEIQQQVTRNTTIVIDESQISWTVYLLYQRHNIPMYIIDVRVNVENTQSRNTHLYIDRCSLVTSLKSHVK